MAFVTLGVHFGQKHSPTAIAVSEIEERKVGGWYENHFMVRHLERLPIGTPYPEVARRVQSIVWRIKNRHKGTPILYLDATGIGAPVVDLFRKKPVQAKIVEVYFNHGDRHKEVAYLEVSLGKAFLVTRLQTLLQTNRVHLPESEEARILAEELMEYEVRVSEDANDKYEAFKVGTQDDLVTALGLALQDDGPRRAIIYGG